MEFRKLLVPTDWNYRGRKFMRDVDYAVDLNCINIGIYNKKPRRKRKAF